WGTPSGGAGLPPLWRLPGPALGGELPLVQRAKLLQRGRLARALVLADARDAGKAQRHPRAVGRAALDLVVLDLDDDLGPHPHRVAVVAQGEGAQALGQRT